MRASRVEGPLLGGLDEHGVSIEAAQEVAVAFDLAFQAAHLVAPDGEFGDFYAVQRAEAALGHGGCGDGHVVACGGEAFGELAHDLLHAAPAGVVELAA